MGFDTMVPVAVDVKLKIWRGAHCHCSDMPTKIWDKITLNTATVVRLNTIRISGEFIDPATRGSKERDKWLVCHLLWANQGKYKIHWE